MTKQEMLKKYNVPAELLDKYEKIKKCTSYTDKDIKNISMIMTLYDAGFDNDEVKNYISLCLCNNDTANTYAHGTSGEYLGRAIKNNVARYKAVIASKVYFNDGHLSKKAITREIDGTLKRLGTDYLDLYIIHRFDYGTPIEETMEVLHNLVKLGKVRAFGAYRLSKIPALLFGKTGIFEVF